MKWELVSATAGELDEDNWVSLPLDDADHKHIWEALSTLRGIAYRCEICWDRTD